MSKTLKSFVFMFFMVSVYAALLSGWVLHDYLQYASVERVIENPKPTHPAQ